MTQHLAATTRHRHVIHTLPIQSLANRGALGREFGTLRVARAPLLMPFEQVVGPVNHVYVPAVSMGSGRNRAEGLHYN
jgi:hypothetical protein